MPITILEYVKAKTGDRATYTVEDHRWAGVDILGGCQICAATIASYNAYPSTFGYWRCADCIAGDGFATVEDYQFSIDARAGCPSCGCVDDIHETRIITAEDTVEYPLECGNCGEIW